MITVCFCLTCFTKCHTSQVYPSCCKWQHFIEKINKQLHISPSCSVTYIPLLLFQLSSLLLKWFLPVNHSLLQGILPTQGSNLGLLHRRQILYCLSHQEVHIHTIEHYGIMKMNEIQLHVTIQMNLPQYWMKEATHKTTHPQWFHLHET